MTDEPELPLKPTIEDLADVMGVAAKMAEQIGGVLIARAEVDGRTITNLIGPSSHIFGLAELLSFDVKLMLRGEVADAKERNP